MTSDVNVNRTRAATTARVRGAARRRALHVARHLDLLDDDVLSVITALLANEAVARNLDPEALFTS